MARDKTFDVVFVCTGNRARSALAEALFRHYARSLPADRRGIAPTLAGLSGKWAMDKDYAAKVASVANQILSA